MSGPQADVTDGWVIGDSESRWIWGPAFVIAVDLEGNVVHSLRDESSRYLASTSVLEHEGRLFIGSITEDTIGVVSLPR